MTTATHDTAHLDPGQTNEGAPVAPADTGREKPEGMDEQHGTPASKEGSTDAAAKEAEAKAAAEKKTADEAAKTEDKGPLKEYISLDDPHGQAAIDVLKESGVDPNEANSYFAKAIQSGDLADVDWAAIESRVGKSKALLIKTGVENYYNGIAAQRDQTVKQTHEIFGGAENWTKVAEWAKGREANDKSFKTQVDDIREMLNEGGAKAAAGARELLRLYNSAPDTKGLQNGRLVVGDSTGTVIGTPLNRADYVAEYKKAHDRRASPAELAALDARRRAGRAQGM